MVMTDSTVNQRQCRIPIFRPWPSKVPG